MNTEKVIYRPALHLHRCAVKERDLTNATRKIKTTIDRVSERPYARVRNGTTDTTREQGRATAFTLSPVATMSLSVERTGRPAPTVASWRNLAPLSRLAATI